MNVMGPKGGKRVKAAAKKERSLESMQHAGIQQRSNDKIKPY